MKLAVTWLVKRPEAALFLDPGFGKTSIVLKAYLARRKAGLVRKLVVFAPQKACFSVWDSTNPTSQLRLWTDFHGLRSVVVHGAKKEKLFEEDADIYVFTYDGLEWLLPLTPYPAAVVERIARDPSFKPPKRKTDKTRLRALLKRGVDGVVFDELSKLKKFSSGRSKLVREMHEAMRLRWGMTGSPAANSIENLFNEAYVLDCGAALGSYITKFRNTYFDSTGYGGYTYVPKPGAEELIYKRLKNLALRLDVNDKTIDLPELVERNIWIELPEDARRIYNELQEELITAIENEEVTAANAAVASFKCRQVASGGLYLPDGTIVHLHNEKGGALAELVDELQGKPLLVGYETHHDLERINAALGYVVPVINGKTTKKDFNLIEAAWNANELPVLAGHPAAMAHALNLQLGGGCHAAWYTTTWDGELYDQFIKRLLRRGATAKRVMCYRIVARDTVEATGVLPAISRKRRTQNNLYEALLKNLPKRIRTSTKR